MHKKNVLTIRVPEDLKSRLEKTAALQGVSVNQFALYAFTKELSEIEAGSFFRSRVQDKPKEKLLAEFDKVMAKVKRRKAKPWDSLD